MACSGHSGHTYMKMMTIMVMTGIMVDDDSDDDGGDNDGNNDECDRYCQFSDVKNIDVIDSMRTSHRLYVMHNYVCSRENNPFNRFRARRATFHQSGYSRTEATRFAARGFVLLQPGNRVRCIRCARPLSYHWVSDLVMGPNLKISRYCLEENDEGNDELYIG